MILDGLLTTCDSDGRPHLAAMGATVDDSGAGVGDTLQLRPFQGSATLENLRRTGQAVFHITDDAEQLARAAIGKLEPLPELRRAEAIDGFIVAGACRWFALRVTELNDLSPRVRVQMQVVDRGRLRDFFGFNRAKHAVVETAILATRLHLLPEDEIRRRLGGLRPLVEKTAGCRERVAMERLERYIEQWLARKT